MGTLAATGTPGADGPEGLADWRRVNWRTVNRPVRHLRRRIFRATQQGDWTNVRSLERLMLRSHAYRLQAVRRVTQVNHGKHTAGVDRVPVKTPRARGALVDVLARYQPWRAQPTRRVVHPQGQREAASARDPDVRSILPLLTGEFGDVGRAGPAWPASLLYRGSVLPARRRCASGFALPDGLAQRGDHLRGEGDPARMVGRRVHS